VKVKLNSRAIASVLRGREVRAYLHSVADPIADAVRANPAIIRHNATVYTRDAETDRAVVDVVVDHPAGLALEGKYAVLSSAAQSAGLVVGEKDRSA
jgi:hypothetical protein